MGPKKTSIKNKQQECATLICDEFLLVFTNYTIYIHIATFFAYNLVGL